jgi:hypothetical protein
LLKVQDFTAKAQRREGRKEELEMPATALIFFAALCVLCVFAVKVWLIPYSALMAA